MTRIFSALAFYLFCMSSLAQSQHVSVVEYHPAPGQFVNVLPEYSEGMTHEQKPYRRRVLYIWAHLAVM